MNKLNGLSLQQAKLLEFGLRYVFELTESEIEDVKYLRGQLKAIIKNHEQNEKDSQ